MGSLFSRDFSSSVHKKTKSDLGLQEKKSNSRILWGREYHNINNSAYMLPKDNKEIDRLHDQHFIIKELLGFNIMTEAFRLLDFEKKRLYVLDLCCGPATWLCEESLEYPNCHFTGIDMCSLWPQDIRPVNLQFTEADIIRGLPYPDQYFDFIQLKFAELSFRPNEWAFVVHEIERVLKDGGCFQWVDMDMRIHVTTEDTVIKSYNEAFESFCTSYQLNPSTGSKLCQFLTNEKMSVIQTEYREIPLGWGGLVGNAYLKTFVDFLEGLGPWLKESFNIEKEEDYQLLVQNTKDAFINSKAHINMYAFLVRKQQ
ncbi:unnamed protein product [Rhizopus stolonifer]